MRAYGGLVMIPPERARADHLIGEARDPLIVSSLHRLGGPLGFESSLHR